jgi:hypothetical protein
MAQPKHQEAEREYGIMSGDEKSKCCQSEPPPRPKGDSFDEEDYKFTSIGESDHAVRSE